MEKVSVIIPTYNRFKFLMNTIESVKKQTHTNLEIIVINDRSTQQEYYDYDWHTNNIVIIHLEINTKEIFGYGCAGYVRNKGIEQASGKYIAFCDDDDIWFPKKIELQLNAMKNTGCKMCSTDGLIGVGMYNSKKKYPKYIAEFNYKTLQNIYKRKGSNLLDNGFPNIWTLDFLKIHNCVICSSVLIEKQILEKIGGMSFKVRGQDYEYWLKALEYTNNVYIEDICIYYDLNHGNGSNH